MTRVTVDAEMRKVLLDFTKPLELCDESGSLVGKFIPAMPRIVQDDWIDLTSDISDEEIKREIESGDEGYSTGELIAEIKKMRGI